MCKQVSDVVPFQSFVSVGKAGNMGPELYSSSSSNHVSWIVNIVLRHKPENSDTGSHLNPLMSVCLLKAFPPAGTFEMLTK